jgi:predicted MFS family arabinose efflux permease
MSSHAPAGEIPRQLRWVGVGVFVITVAGHVRSPLLPDMGRDLDMGPAALGAFVAAFALGRIAADIPAGRLTDSRSSQSMLAMGAAIVAGSSLLAGLAPASVVAYAASFVLGVGTAWTNTTGIAAFAEAPRERRGVAMSGFATALLVGQAVGPALGGGIAAPSNWRVAFGVGAVIAFITGAAFVRATPGRTGRERASAATTPDPVIPRRVRAAIFLLPAVQFAIGGALLHTLVPIVGDGELGLGVGTVGLAMGLAGALRLVAALTSGRVSDRWSRRWALFPGLLLQIAGLVAFALWGTRAGWWAAIVLTSLGSTAVNVGATMLADLSEGGRLGPNLAMFRMTGDVALLVAPLLAGILYETTGRAVAMLPLIGFVAAATLLAARVIPETRSPR